jgi:splicing suppressor protein 51
LQVRSISFQSTNAKVFYLIHPTIALRTTLHVPPGTPETEEQAVGKPQFRIFILGARYESSLPPNAWEQLALLFPAAHLHVYFIGPQTALPRPAEEDQPKPSPSAPPPSSGIFTSDKAVAEKPVQEDRPGEAARISTETEKKKENTPMIWEILAPPPIPRLKTTRSVDHRYGHASYTVPYNEQFQITGIRANYLDIHPQFEETLDPYSDVFFFFHPGFGFPSTRSHDETTGEPMLQISSPTEWGGIVPMILRSKCPMFVTGFSPADMERDIKSLSTDPEIDGAFDWVITPGPNAFCSEKWEVSDFDPRVMIRPNWGIWGIRGKMNEIQERPWWQEWLKIGKPKDQEGLVKT